MPDPKFPRQLVRKLEAAGLPLQTLDAICQLRRYLDALESSSILKARELGASPADIGEAIGISRQAVYNRLRALQEQRADELRLVLPDLEVSTKDG